VTTLLILGGVLLGVILGIAGAAIGAAVASSRRRRARSALLREVAAVARERVLEPIAAEVDRAGRVTTALAVARG
jgi:hypothetical protein